MRRNPVELSIGYLKRDMNRYGRFFKSLLPVAAGAVLASFFTFSTGCSTESYCFSCEEGDEDASIQDAQTDTKRDTGGGGQDAVIDLIVVETGCGADLQNDPLNCGECGHVCEIPNAYAKCEKSFCIIDRCATGFYDINGAVEDGCEYECAPLRDENGNPVTEEKVCDGKDDDCDGLIDEVFDLQTDAVHCGKCNSPCLAPPNATMKCEGGKCVFDKCYEGYHDVNGDITPESIENGTTDGCECNTLGIEICNYNDDDCDGEIDEGFDLTSDVNNCGACQNVCGDLFPNANTICKESACSFGGCLDGYHDIDGVLVTGCEYKCTPTVPSTEVCDGADNDCNGFIDDGVLPGVGNSCGSSVGECKLGKQQCIGGKLECIGAVAPQVELCDGLDNNCDGTPDEGCPTAGALVRLDVGGSNPGQHSTAQLSVATYGANTYAAYLDRRSGNADIRLNFSTSPGGAWQNADLAVASTAANEVEPWVFTSSSSVYVAYGLFSSTNVRRIQLARTGIAPATWTRVQAEKNTIAASDSFYVRGIVAGKNGSNDRVVLVWQTLNGTSRDIFLQASNDSGATWRAADLRVNSVAKNAELPAIATDGQGKVFIVWSDLRSTIREVLFDVYDAEVGTLSGNKRLSTENHPTRLPSVAADSLGNVHVAWTDAEIGKKKSIYVATSTNRGVDFGLPKQVNTPVFADADTVNIVAHQGRAIAAWEDTRSGLSDIYVNVWKAGSWLPQASRADGGPRGAYRSTHPKVAFGSGDLVFVTYQEFCGTGANVRADVHANFSRDGGVTFQPNDTRLDRGPVGLADSMLPFVVAPAAASPFVGDVPLIIWLDNYDGSKAALNADVYAAILNFP